MCPDGPKRVPNCQKHLGLPLRTPWTPLDHSGMLTSLRCATIFVSFIGAFFWDTQYLFHFFFGNFRKVDPRAPTDEYTYVVSLWNRNLAKELITDLTHLKGPAPAQV